jgi:dynein light intermediate chain 1
VEAVNKGWSLDIEEPEEPLSNGYSNAESTDGTTPGQFVGRGAVETYEETIRDPSLDALQTVTAESNGLKLEVSSQESQTFLAEQLELLDKIRQEASGMEKGRLAGGQRAVLGTEGADEANEDEGRVSEHIGPVQFNMGGIQVDADDMLQRLKVK